MLDPRLDSWDRASACVSRYMYYSHDSTTVLHVLGFHAYNVVTLCNVQSCADLNYTWTMRFKPQGNLFWSICA
jgi:hypothetical protein